MNKVFFQYMYCELYVILKNLEPRLKEIIHNVLYCYKFIVLMVTYPLSLSTTKQKVLHRHGSHQYVGFPCRVRLFQQIIGIPMKTNGAPPLVHLFLYSYDAEFIRGLCCSCREIIYLHVLSYLL